MQQYAVLIVARHFLPKNHIVKAEGSTSRPSLGEEARLTFLPAAPDFIAFFRDKTYTTYKLGLQIASTPAL